MIQKISHIKSALEKFGIKISLDNIRKLEKAKIIHTTHNPITRHRQFSEDEFKRSMKNLILYYFNTPIKDILEDKPEMIKDRIKKIRQALRLLT